MGGSFRRCTTLGPQIEEKRRKQRKSGKGDVVEEDDPAKYKHAIYVLTTKLFADAERKRRQQEDRDQEERKRKREQELLEEEQQKRDREWHKNYEESRENRVTSWKSFQTGKGKKSKPYKPPKHRAETR